MDGDGTTLRTVVHRIGCFNQIMGEVRCSISSTSSSSSSKADLH